MTNSVELVGFLTPKNTEETRMGFSAYQDRCAPGVRAWKDRHPGPFCVSRTGGLREGSSFPYQHPLEVGSLIPITLLVGEGKRVWKMLSGLLKCPGSIKTVSTFL